MMLVSIAILYGLKWGAEHHKSPLGYGVMDVWEAPFRIKFDYQRNVSIKVLFDNGHGQYYNASKLSQFLRDIERTFWVEVDVNYGSLTDTLLSNYDILILVDIDESIGLTTEEISAIKNFINNGGALLICATKDRYFNPTYFNQITSEYGIEWLDVTVYDLDDYDYKADYPLVHTWGDNDLARELSDNGTYVIKMQTTALNVTSNNVMIIGTGDNDPGNQATFANDSNGNIIVTGSDVIMFAAVDLENGGRIFASGGTNFLLTSQYLYLNFDYDNKLFALSVFEWLLKEFVDDVFDVLPTSSDKIKVFCAPDNSYRVLKEFIMSANQSLFLNIYQFKHQYIYDILKNLTQEKPGINIKVIMERYPVAGYDREYNYYYADKMVNELGITVRWANEEYYDITHAKYAIADNKCVLVFTGNYKYIDFPYYNTSNGNRNFGAILWNKYVVDIFLEVFLNDFDISQAYYSQTPQSAAGIDSPGTYQPKFDPKYVETTAKYVPMFGPESVYYHLKKLIRRAKHFIYFIFPYTRNNTRLLVSLLDELEKAVNRGVTVMAIINSGETETKDMLTRRGVYVQYIPSDLNLHAKAMIIDDKIVYIGSSNWSRTGLGVDDFPNREAGIGIWSTDVAVYCRDVFGYDWERKTGSFDSDGDGLSDLYEQDHGLDQYDNDTDNDGYSDWEEVVIHDSDPLNASDPPTNTPPKIDVITPANGSTLNTSTVLVEWNAYDEDGIDYNEVRLDDGAWIYVGASTQYTFYDVSDGDHTIYIRSTDTEGLSNTTIIQITVAEPPKVNLNDPVEKEGEDGKYRAYSSSGTVIIGWGASDNSGVDHTEVRVDGGSWVNIGNVSCYMITGLSDGNHTIEIKVVDVYGNYNLSTIEVIVDLTPPHVQLSSDSYYVDSTDDKITISWSGSDNTEIEYYMVKIGSNPWQYVGNNTSITIDNNLLDGTYTVYIKAVDKAGNYNVTYSMLIVDRSHPIISILNPQNNSYIGRMTVSISWSVNDDNYVESMIRIDDGEWVGLGRATTYNATLTEGQHTIVVLAKDIVGNNNTTKIILTIDMSPPQLDITNPQDGEILTSSTVTIEWSAYDENGIAYYLVRIDSGSWIKTQSTSHTVSIGDGVHSVTVRAYDHAGNYEESVIVFMIDTLSTASSSDTDGRPANGCMTGFRYGYVLSTQHLLINEARVLEVRWHVVMHGDTLRIG